MAERSSALGDGAACDLLARMLHKSSLSSNCTLAGVFRQRQAKQPLLAEADGWTTVKQ